jgi:hypothetical protein
MATITVRALNPVTWEPQQGNGQNNFISDLQAVAQIIAQRLRLFTGEWFLNLLDGTPMFQTPNSFGILGGQANSGNIQLMIAAISQRVSQTIYVTQANILSATYLNRQLQITLSALTPFGTIYITNAPGAQAQLGSS